jgi:hypothetical protein
LREGTIAEGETALLTTIAIFREPWEAHMFYGRLQFETIPAVIVHECHISVNWQWSTALGGVKVQVPRSWAREAQIIETRCRMGEFEADLKAEFGDLDGIKCPNFGSEYYSERWPILETVLCMLLAFAFGGPPPRMRRFHCKTCGADWKHPG